MKKKYSDNPELKKELSLKLKKLYENKELRDKVSRLVKESFKKDPSIKKRISASLIKSKANVGEKNGMKQIEARKKVSKARIKMFSDPKVREEYSKKTKKAWEDGKFEGVSVGRCRWYDYKHSDGKVYKVQGTWELAFIEWVDKNNLKFTCHRGRIPYRFKGRDKNYYPDFWIDEWNSYVDVKCDYFYKISSGKFKAIRRCNPDISLKILFKKDLLKLGVVL